MLMSFFSILNLNLSRNLINFGLYFFNYIIFKTALSNPSSRILKFIIILRPLILI